MVLTLEEDNHEIVEKYEKKLTTDLRTDGSDGMTPDYPYK
jgi:hypothetical protein